MTHWIIIAPNGDHVAKVTTKGKAEPERDCPEGHSFIKVNRLSHDPTERYDERARRWVKCPVLTIQHNERKTEAAKQLIAKLLPEPALSLLFEMFKERLEHGRH